MNIELKPCPFCGGEAEARVSPNSRSEEGMSFYEVRCKKCGVYVTGKSFNFWTVEYNAEKPQDLLSAVERWNKQAKREDRCKTGKWEKDIYGNVVCSECKRKPICGNLTAYCPHCGAKMEVDE